MTDSEGFGGTYVDTYLIEVVGVMLDDQSA